MLSLALAALVHFRDVPADSWSFPDITILASAGIVHGESSGLFAPALPVSRQQAAATLARTLELPRAVLPPLRDQAAISPVLREDVASAVAAGILEGTSEGYLEPLNPLSRAAAAALIARAFKIAPESGSPSFRDRAEIPAYALGDVAALASAGIVEGDLEGDFRPLSPVTRAEWAAMLLRAIACNDGVSGAPAIVAGSLQAIYPPDEQDLAAASPLGGAAGAVGFPARTIDLAAGGLVYRGAQPADLFALAPGDLAVAYVGKDGTAPLIVDLAAAAASDLSGKVADLSPQTLYLDTGATLAIGSGATISYDGRSLSATAWPSYLLSAKVAVGEQPLAVRVTEPYAFDLSGTITAAGPTGFTLRLTSTSALAPLVPSLSAGDLVTVATGAKTVIAPVGANAPAAPAAGIAAEVQGTILESGSIAADHVALSQ